MRDTGELSVFPLVQRKGPVSTQQDGSKRRKELSPDTNHDGTLILDFSSSELWKNKCRLLKLPSLWYFVYGSPHSQILYVYLKGVFFFCQIIQMLIVWGICSLIPSQLCICLFRNESNCGLLLVIQPDTFRVPWDSKTSH